MKSSLPPDAGDSMHDGDDPFAFNDGTQPLDDDDNCDDPYADFARPRTSSILPSSSRRVPTPALQRSISLSSSSSLPTSHRLQSSPRSSSHLSVTSSFAAQSPSASVSSSMVSLSSLQLIGSSRAKADELQFIIDGLNTTNQASIRTRSALQLLETLLNQSSSSLGSRSRSSSLTGPSTDIDGMNLFRAVHGFEAVAVTLPNWLEMRDHNNDIFYTLWIELCYLAVSSSHSSNTNVEAYLPSNGIEILVAKALDIDPPSPTASIADNTDTDMGRSAPLSNPVSLRPPIKSKRSASTKLVSSNELKQIVIEHEQQLERPQWASQDQHQLKRIHIEDMVRQISIERIGMSEWIQRQA